MQEELVDRFGVLPEPAQALVASHRLRIRARPLGIVKVDAGPERTLVQMAPKPPFDPLRIINLIQSDKRYRLAGPDRLRIDRPAATLQKRTAMVSEFLSTLGG
jgi:transcription-repair coupling factor (superfamily II helicase)